MPYLRVKNELPLIPGYSEGAIAYAPDAADAPLNECICCINPVQSGSGDPSPSNVRPITGHTELNLVHTGKNLFDKTAVSNNKWLSTTTGLEEDASGYCVSDYIPVKNGQTVFIPTSGTARRWFYDTNKNPVTYLNNSGNQAYTPVASGYIRVSIQVTGATPVSLDTYQIEVGSSATTYEAYTGSTTTTDLGTTVYGGTLDVVSGVLTATHGFKTFTGDSSEAWTNVLNGFNIIIPDAKQIQIPKANWLKGLTSQSITNLQSGECAFASVDALNFNCKYDQTADLTAWKTYLASNNLQVYYELATPTTTQLTPKQLNSILGDNNFYHDCNGDMKITYIRRLDS